ncbi:MAG TPA: hypothetical protein VMF91_20510 [Bryobacteraceae bacterium]|nr:hypothetical protein [Bryobacteraceae bacterium]
MIRRLCSSVLPSPVSIVPDSAYWQDEGQPSSLLEETCREQVGRLRTLRLVDAYLATAAGGRRRQAIADEQKALQGLYEAVWTELQLAFSDVVVRAAREWAEAQLPEESHGRAQRELF